MQLRVIFSYILILSGIAYPLMDAETVNAMDAAVQTDSVAACELTSDAAVADANSDQEEACTADINDTDEDGYADEGCLMNDSSNVGGNDSN
jgi:hypothetical protein